MLRILLKEIFIERKENYANFSCGWCPHQPHRGAGVGFALGFVIDAVSGDSYNVSPAEAGFGFGLVFAVPGLIIGAVSGALTNPEKVYDLHQLTLSQKSREIDKHCGN